MMLSSAPDRTRLLDAEWLKIVRQLQEMDGIYIGSWESCRGFLEAVLWVLRVGGQWRSLPADRGRWNTVFKRFSRWSALGVWKKLHGQFAQDADLQDVSIDSSVIRGHACAAGAAHSNQEQEALGRSRGGFGCKIHAAVDALGLPIRFLLTGGQASDIEQAKPLMENLVATCCLADKGYDSNEFVSWLEAHGIKVVIPPRSNRIAPRSCDFHHYKERHVVECMFGKLKYYRRIATRHEKKAINFMGMLSFCATLLWLR